jgi:hypothetical protein
MQHVLVVELIFERLISNHQHQRRVKRVKARKLGYSYSIFSTHRNHMALPSEIWTQIFHLAADEDEIFRYELPISLDTSVWARNTIKDKLPQSDIQDWTLKTPSDALNFLQRRSYATKKVCQHLGSLLGRISVRGVSVCQVSLRHTRERRGCTCSSHSKPAKILFTAL